ncbi:MAG: hypothetical protein LQ340_003860 [Diploschistes diacapsis]|nr:MAG: hypothetical protein LQ340_003860 [Diploschistes diacapsis]
MQQQKPSHVPKFKSFRPKPTVGQDASTEESQSQEHVGRYPWPARTDHAAIREKGRTSSSRDKWEQKLGREARKLDQPSEETVTKVSKNEIFVSDKRGDQDNVRYGSIHRYARPQYSRAGRGSVMGLHRSLKIDVSEMADKDVVLLDTMSHKLRNKPIFRRLRSQDEIRIRAQSTASPEDLSKDYLLLNDRKVRLRGRSEAGEKTTGDLSQSDDDYDDYRSIQGTAKLSVGKSDVDIVSNTDNIVKDDIPSPRVLPTLGDSGAALIRIVEKEPDNAEAWFDLIKHQDSLQIHRQAGKRATFSEKQSSSDIKLSLYEKALKSVKDPHSTEILLNGLLMEARQVWDADRLRKKWHDTIAKYPRSGSLWIHYLNFLQTDSIRFKFDDVKALYGKCFETLRRSAYKGDSPEDFEHHAYALLRVTLLLRAADFPEQAIAIWQANLEWNLCRPPIYGSTLAPDGSIEMVKKSLEEFWDAEVPRIGEPGALGWATYSLHQQEALELEPSQQGSIETTSNLENWEETEARQSMQCVMPARTTDNVNENDLYRVVLFSDIEAFLLEFSHSAFLLLINSFLLFCQLPTLPCNSGVARWLEDSFITNDISDFSDLKDLFNPNSDNSGLLEPDINRAIEKTPFHMVQNNFCVSLDTLYTKPQLWFSSFASRTNSTNGTTKATHLDWIHQIFESLANSVITNIEFLEYYVAFELHFFPNRAQKIAKSLLRKQQSNLRLYNIYALVESQLGKLDKAQDALRTAMIMSKTNPDTSILRRTLIWETLQFQGPEAALSQLLATFTTDNNRQVAPEVDAQTLLSLQKHLIATRDLSLSTSSHFQALANIDLLILLAYLTNPSPLQAALAIFTSNIALLSGHLPQTSQTHQLLHQSLSRLLHYHVTHSTSFQPSLIRSTLSQSLSLFPTNTIFLSLYAWNEARFRLNDRVRTVISDILYPTTTSLKPSVPSAITACSHLLPTSNLIPYLFSLSTELRRPAHMGSNAHTIRAAFERALADESVVHSAAVWEMYFRFEVSCGEVKKAKGVFYRAVAACPWAKGLYLLGWRYLSAIGGKVKEEEDKEGRKGKGKREEHGFMGREELRSVWEMIEGRELRIRVSLEED